MASGNINIFGDKVSYKDGAPGTPAFDLLLWIPDPFLALFQKEAVVDIYFNTDTDAIIKDAKTGAKGLKNRGTGQNALFITGKNCKMPAVGGDFENHKFLQLRADEKDPKAPSTSCFDIKKVPTATANGQNCIIFISFRNVAKELNKPRILFTNDSLTRSVKIEKKSELLGEIEIHCGIRKVKLQHNVVRWQQLVVQYTCQDGEVECNYTLYNHGAKNFTGTITAPVDPKDIYNNFFIAGFGPKKTIDLAGVYDLSQLQIYNFYNKDILPSKMTNLIINALYNRALQHKT